MTHTPSRLAANGLFLLTTVLIITLGVWAQSISITWGLLATEVFLILLPTLILVRLGQLPPRETLRLRRADPRLIALGPLIGAGSWFLSITLEGLGANLLGYTPQNTAIQMPEGTGSILLYVMALAVVAPLCEELLWRGYIQRAYEAVSGGRAVWVVSLFFALWHLRFAGLLGLIPIALVLGYLAWRSDSLLPSILAHMACNGMAALVFVLRNSNLVTNTILGIGILAGVILGTPIALAGLWLFRRWTTAPPSIEAPEAAPRPRVLAWAWPLIVFIIMYGALATFEVIAGRFPHLLARSPLELGAAPWEAEATWQYTAYNINDEAFGKTTCHLTPDASGYTLACEDDWQAYEVHPNPGSTYINSGVERRSRYRWTREPLVLTSASEFSDYGEGNTHTLTVTATTDGLHVTGEQSRSVPADAFFQGEWLWRLAALPFDDAHTGRASAHTERAHTGRAPLVLRNTEPQPAAIFVRGREDVALPSGNVNAWRVEIVINGRQQPYTAWYATDTPHTLLKYDNGMETFVLTE